MLASRTGLHGKILTRKAITTHMTRAQMAEDVSGGSAVGGGESEMIWIEFVEAVAVTACYLYRNPYIPLQVKLQVC